MESHLTLHLQQHDEEGVADLQTRRSTVMKQDNEMIVLLQIPWTVHTYICLSRAEFPIMLIMQCVSFPFTNLDYYIF